MPYVLGVDVGRSRGTAAVCQRVGPAFGPPEVVPIDGGNRWSKALIAVASDGEVVVGQAAERRAVVESDRVARDFMSRVGDAVPVLLGGELYPAETLAAAVVASIVDLVAQAEGAQPERIAVTHPPEWGSYRRGLLREALHAAGVPGVLLLPTVVAAAEAAHEREPVPVGSAIVMTLIGGRQCEHAVLYRGQVAFDLATHLHADDADAGDHLDDLLASHVLGVNPAHEPDPAAMVEFRMACNTAKERLSVAPEVRVPLPYAPGDVTVTRTIFEELARPALAAAVDDLGRLVASVPDEQLAGVILAGGTARVPLLAALATARLDCPVTVEDDPATAACRGAALAARPRLAAARLPVGQLTAEGSSPGFPPSPAGGSPNPADSPLVAPGMTAPDMLDSAGVRMTVEITRSSDSPPPRPPVEVTPLEPPRKRFARRKPERVTEDDR
jgi:molecular chaperone DnaK (HSP70)